MKNITVSVDDEVYRQARVRAAEADSSVSALVKAFLVGLADNRKSKFERLKREEQALRASLRASGSRFSASDRLSREEIYDRNALH